MYIFSVHQKHLRNPTTAFKLGPTEFSAKTFTVRRETTASRLGRIVFIAQDFDCTQRHDQVGGDNFLEDRRTYIKRIRKCDLQEEEDTSPTVLVPIKS
jgi:hypothetical protein